jgi:DNA-binding LacI/PurR family transcriptional regulator
MDTDGIVGLIAEPTKSALPSPNLDLYNSIRKSGIPVVLIHGYLDSERDDHVIADDVRSGFDAANYLADMGHMRIGGVFKSDDIQGHKRYEGMVSAICSRQKAIDGNNIIWLATQDAFQARIERHEPGCLSERLLFTQSNTRTLIGQDTCTRLHFASVSQESDYAMPTAATGQESGAKDITSCTGMLYQADVAMLLGKLHLVFELEGWNSHIAIQ